MGQQEQPLFFMYQIYALIIELGCLIVCSAIKINFNIVKFWGLLLWITLAETFIPMLLRRIGASDVARTIIYYLPFYIFAIPYSLNLKNSVLDLKSRVLGFGVVLILLVLNKKEMSQILNGIQSRCPITKNRFTIELFNDIIALISEEILFRGYWLTCIKEDNLCLLILSSTFLFVYAHWINRWANKMYKMKNYIILLILGLILAYVYVKTKSLLYCCFLHWLFNISDYYLLLRRLMAKDRKCLFNDYE